MNISDLPCLESAIGLCLLGVILISLVRSPMTVVVVISGLALGLCLVEWLVPNRPRLPGFAVDALNALLLPLTALLHLLTALMAPRAESDRSMAWGILLSLAVSLAIFGCSGSWLLVGMLALGTLPILLESRGPLVVGHLGVFVILLTLGQLVGGPAGAVLTLLALLLRSGTIPGHAWVTELFASSRLGPALLFVAPLPGLYAAARLVLPVATDWTMRGLGTFSLITALVAAGMTLVQRDARRFFALVFLSHSAMVFVGLELLTPVCLTGSLALGISLALSLTGLGLVLWVLEARFGRLSLTTHRGLYDQSPALATCFLLMGLATVGFPGTVGFMCVELLVDGAVTENVFVGLAVVLAGFLNSVALIRVYFLLFTGPRHASSVPLGIMPRERIALLVLTILVLVGGGLPHIGLRSRYEAARSILKTTHPDRQPTHGPHDEAADHAPSRSKELPNPSLPGHD